MRFAEPWLLLLLPAVLVVLPLAWWLHERARRRLLLRFALAPTLSRVAPGRSFGLLVARRSLLLLAALLIGVAAARPQWGGSGEEVRRRGLDVAFVLDLSQSMLAPAAPGSQDTRLAAAKRAATDLMALLPGERLALVAFAGQAQVLCPLTVDDAALSLFLDHADPSLMATPGSDVGEGIRKALAVFPARERKFKVLCLLTDGEDHEGRAVEMAERARSEGVVIHAIGFGSSGGEPIPLLGERGEPQGYLKDQEGHVVSSRLDADGLGAITAAAGGSYWPASAGDRALRGVADAVAAMEKREFESKVAARLEDQVEWPLLGAFVALVLEVALGLLVRERPAVALAGAAAVQAGEAPAAPAKRRFGRRRRVPSGAAAVLLISLAAGPAVAADSLSEQADAAFAAKDYVRAAELYRQAIDQEGDSDRLRYNLGTALLRAEETDPAVAELVRAVGPGNGVSDLAARAHYNLGNAYVQAGKAREALEQYRRSLGIAAADRDAKHNYELARRMLEQQPTPTPTPTPTPEPQAQPSPSPQPEGEPSPQPGDSPPPPSPAEPQPKQGLTRQQAEQLLDALAAQEGQDRQREKRPASERRPLKDW